MRVAVVRADGRATASVVGELDVHSGPTFGDAVVAELAGAPPGFVLEVVLTDVSFCDSSGISQLLRVRGAAREAGAELVLVSPHRRVRRTLALTGLDRLFDVRDLPPDPSGP